MPPSVFPPKVLLLPKLLLLLLFPPAAPVQFHVIPEHAQVPLLYAHEMPTPTPWQELAAAGAVEGHSSGLSGDPVVPDGDPFDAEGELVETASSSSSELPPPPQPIASDPSAKPATPTRNVLIFARS